MIKDRARIHIRGDTLAAWATAAGVKRALPEALVSIAREGERGDAGWVALDENSAILAASGKTAEELILSHGAALHLADCLIDWRKDGHDAFVSRGEPIPPLNGSEWHFLVSVLHLRQGREHSLRALAAPLNFQSRLAAAGRFLPPSKDRRSPRSLLRPSVRVESLVLRSICKETALEIGVTEGEFSDGYWLTLDCRAQSSLGARTCFSDAELLPFSSARTEDGEILVEAQFGNRHLTFIQEAPTHLPTLPWDNDVLVMGEAAARIGPLFAADGKLLDQQLTRLLRHLPARREETQALAKAYNLLAGWQDNHLRDWQLLALRRCTGMKWEPPPIRKQLKRRIDLFKSRGRPCESDKAVFEKHEWVELMIGLGFEPDASHPALEALETRQIAAYLGTSVRAFDQTIAAAPNPSEFLSKAATSS